MEEKESLTSDAAPEPAGQNVCFPEYETVRSIGYCLGILSFVFMFIGWGYGIDFCLNVPIGFVIFYFLHLLTASAFFLLAPWTRWALLATLTYDAWIMIVSPYGTDFFCYIRPITLHDVMAIAPMREDAILVLVTALLYPICFIILVHPKLGRFTAGLEQFLRGHAKILHGR